MTRDDATVNTVSSAEEGCVLLAKDKRPEVKQKRPKFKLECDTSETGSDKNTRCSFSVNKRLKWFAVFTFCAATVILLGIILSERSGDGGELAGAAIKAVEKLDPKDGVMGPILAFVKEYREKRIKKKNLETPVTATTTTTTTINSTSVADYEYFQQKN
jgi:hypothetical protein